MNEASTSAKSQSDFCGCGSGRFSPLKSAKPAPSGCAATGTGTGISTRSSCTSTARQIISGALSTTKRNSRGLRHQVSKPQRSDERHRERGSAAYRALAQQPKTELTPEIPTKRARQVPLPVHAKLAEIRRPPFFNPQFVQFGAQPLRQTILQMQPRRCSHRVAPTWRGVKNSFTV